MKAYQAYASGGFRVTRDSPDGAALAFFEKFPQKRKCNVIEGETDGMFFTTRHGRGAGASWKDVTKKMASMLSTPISI